MTTVLRLLCTVLALIAAPLAAQPEFPELTGRVVDNADIIPPETEGQLTVQLETLETDTQRQLVVATVPDLQGYEIADFGYQLGRAWELGDAQRNDGMLLLVAPNERQVRIEVGYGLEGVMTDAFSQHIIGDNILPQFRNGDMPAGIVAGTNALVSHLQLTDEEALKAMEDQKGDRFTAALLLLPFLLFSPALFIFGIYFISRISGGNRTSSYSGGPSGSSISTYSSSSSSSSSSWSSSSSSSSFSGGGGSFGGGGSSGSW
ncbi:TPM domain-containing protein [uncultured Erythrobacter sp.]|uniref:TPM domain-containing protein n=1 Tax=uncultured Erythrobacter sp. TaxID=263913 RepID=UPI00260FC0F1|nr:TPM domain-containing protein [uncultured Erythrobacter sp.]